MGRPIFFRGRTHILQGWTRIWRKFSELNAILFNLLRLKGVSRKARSSTGRDADIKCTSPLKPRMKTWNNGLLNSVASHADVLRGSSRFPASLTSASLPIVLKWWGRNAWRTPKKRLRWKINSVAAARSSLTPAITEFHGICYSVGGIEPK